MARADALPDNINVALNEATWLGLVLRPEELQIALSFDVFTLPIGVGGDGHARVTLVLRTVKRIVASLRLGQWDDVKARAVPVTIDELPSVVTSFGGSPVYGWEFFDQPEASWELWRLRLSLDVWWAKQPARHSLSLFKEGRREGHDRILDFRTWFGDVDVYDENGNRVSLDDFAAGGKRWWDGFHAGDERTERFGLYPTKKD